jgi:thiol-disulfide isomerase/thioredoxin
MSSRAKGILAAIGALCAGAAAAQVKPGDAFPPLVAAAFDGALPPTDGRVVLVDFWASWCAPCQESFPAYARLEGEFAPQGLVILAVSVDQVPAAFAGFVRRQRPPFATVRDRGQSLVRRVEIATMPSCYLLGRDGTVRFIHAGFYGSRTENELRREIGMLLREKPPQP